MATVITKTVKPSGGDYSSLILALAAVPVDQVAADEQWVFECDTFAGGLSEYIEFASGLISDATRNIIIKAAVGHEYVHSTGAGFYLLREDIGNGGTIYAGGAGRRNYQEWHNVGVGRTNKAVITAQLPALGLLMEGCTLWNGDIGDEVFSGTFGSSQVHRNSLFIQANSASKVFLNANRDVITENLTFIGGTVGISASGTATNCLYLGAGLFTDDDIGGDYNASQDTTAPGVNSLQNRTTADVVDYAGGDYRTASSSALATAGEGGTYIGFALEAGGGAISITGATPNYSLSSISGSIDLTGSIEVTGQTVNFLYSPVTGSIDLTGEISITGSTPDYPYTALGGAIDLTGQISVTGATASYNYQSIIGLVDLTGEISVIGATPNYSYSALNGLIELGSLISVIGQTPNYNYTGSPGTISLTGEITVTGLTPGYTYSSISGIVVIGEGQKIGTVTAGFAADKYSASFEDDKYSVKYKLSGITVNFKE